jgi:hypothetical protein
MFALFALLATLPVGHLTANQSAATCNALHKGIYSYFLLLACKGPERLAERQRRCLCLSSPAWTGNYLGNHVCEQKNG